MYMIYIIWSTQLLKYKYSNQALLGSISSRFIQAAWQTTRKEPLWYHPTEGSPNADHEAKRKLTE